MEVTTTPVDLGTDQLLIINNGPDDLSIGEFGQDEDDWFPLSSGQAITIKAFNNGIGVVSAGVSDVGVLVGGTGIFPPPVDAESLDLSAYVAKSAYDANTMLVAHTDNTPVAVAISTNQVVGRGNSGNVKGLTPAETVQIISSEVFTQPQGVNAQTGTTYTPVASDAGKLITLSNAGAITVTMPQDSDATIAIGTYMDLFQLGAGQFTIVAGTGATLKVPASLAAKSREQNSSVGAQKISANTWRIFGDLEAA